MEKVVCWWSGGATSAVACKKALEIYGNDNCDVVFIDTKNEDDDTYRFKLDCEKWYGKTIVSITNKKYGSIEDVWYQFLSLNVANGAICSSELKRQVRLDYQRKNKIRHQVFGFEAGKKEENRAKNLLKNYPTSNPVFPLIGAGLTKRDCLYILSGAGIEPPKAYKLGFNNNNCLKTGCVQGGIGYWKKIQKDFPDKFDAMAELEHTLTDLKGKPVTCNKDQGNSVKLTGLINVFLKKHPGYPNKCLDDMKGTPVENLAECNGFCGIAGKLFDQVVTAS